MDLIASIFEVDSETAVFRGGARQGKLVKTVERIFGEKVGYKGVSGFATSPADPQMV